MVQRQLQKKIELELHIFGDGAEKVRLEQLCDELKVKRVVSFHGLVNHLKIKEAIDSYHLFAFSSITEGQCIAAQEILSRGRPIIGTPVGALPEIINEEVGKIVPLNKPEIFASAISDCVHGIISGKFIPSKIKEYYDNNFSHSSIIKKILATDNGI